MSYEYPIQISALFEGHAAHMASFGISAEVIAQMRTNIKDMWTNAPGGWVYEWSKLAAQSAAEGSHYWASVLYGWAKFPCLANDSRRVALAKQAEEYVAAAPTFDVRFERRIFTLPYGGKTAWDEENVKQLPYGMDGILGNACGLDHKPEPKELVAACVRLSRRSLLSENKNAPMLVINGADDPFVPQSDTLVFQGRANTEAHLIPGTGHCAVTKIGEVMKTINGWLKAWAAKG